MGATNSTFQEDDSEPIEVAVATGKQLTDWEFLRSSIVGRHYGLDAAALESYSHAGVLVQQLPSKISPHRSSEDSGRHGLSSDLPEQTRRKTLSHCRGEVFSPSPGVLSISRALSPSARYNASCLGRRSTIAREGRTLNRKLASAHMNCLIGGHAAEVSDASPPSVEDEGGSTRAPSFEDILNSSKQTPCPILYTADRPRSLPQGGKKRRSATAKTPQTERTLTCVESTSALFGGCTRSTAGSLAESGTRHGVTNTRDTRPDAFLDQAFCGDYVRSVSLRLPVSSEKKTISGSAFFAAGELFETSPTAFYRPGRRVCEPERRPLGSGEEKAACSPPPTATGPSDKRCWCSFQSEELPHSSSVVFLGSPGWPSHAVPLRLLLHVAPEIPPSSLPPLPHSDRRGTRCLINHSPVVALLHTLHLLQRRVQADEASRGKRKEGRDASPFLPRSFFTFGGESTTDGGGKRLSHDAVSAKRETLSSLVQEEGETATSQVSPSRFPLPPPGGKRGSAVSEPQIWDADGPVSSRGCLSPAAENSASGHLCVSRAFLPVRLPTESAVAQILFGPMALAQLASSGRRQEDTAEKAPKRSPLPGEASERLRSEERKLLAGDSRPSTALGPRIAFCSLPCVALFVLQHFRAEAYYLAPRLALEGLLNAGLLFLFRGISCPAFLPSQTCIEAWEDNQTQRDEEELHRAPSEDGQTGEQCRSLWFVSPAELGLDEPLEDGPVGGEAGSLKEGSRRPRGGRDASARKEEKKPKAAACQAPVAKVGSTSSGVQKVTHTAVCKRTLFESSTRTQHAFFSAQPSSSPSRGLRLNGSVQARCGGDECVSDPCGPRSFAFASVDTQSAAAAPSCLRRGKKTPLISFVSSSSASSLSLALDVEVYDDSNDEATGRDEWDTTAANSAAALSLQKRPEKLSQFREQTGGGAKTEEDAPTSPATSASPGRDPAALAPGSPQSPASASAAFLNGSRVSTEGQPLNNRQTAFVVGMPQLDWMCGHFAMAVALGGFAHEFTACLSRRRRLRRGPVPLCSPLSAVPQFALLASSRMPPRQSSRSHSHSVEDELGTFRLAVERLQEAQEEKRDYFITHAHPPPVNLSLRRTVAKHTGRQSRTQALNRCGDGEGDENEPRDRGSGEELRRLRSGNLDEVEDKQRLEPGGGRERGLSAEPRASQKSVGQSEAEKEERRQWKRRQKFYEERSGLTAAMAVYWQLQEDFEVCSRYRQRTSGKVNGGGAAQDEAPPTPSSGEDRSRSKGASDAREFHVFLVDGTCRSEFGKSRRARTQDSKDSRASKGEACRDGDGAALAPLSQGSPRAASAGEWAACSQAEALPGGGSGSGSADAEASGFAAKERRTGTERDAKAALRKDGPRRGRSPQDHEVEAASPAVSQFNLWSCAAHSRATSASLTAGRGSEDEDCRATTPLRHSGPDSSRGAGGEGAEALDGGDGPPGSSKETLAKRRAPRKVRVESGPPSPSPKRDLARETGKNERGSVSSGGAASPEEGRRDDERRLTENGDEIAHVFLKLHTVLALLEIPVEGANPAKIEAVQKELGKHGETAFHWICFTPISVSSPPASLDPASSKPVQGLQASCRLSGQSTRAADTSASVLSPSALAEEGAAERAGSEAAVQPRASSPAGRRRGPRTAEEGTQREAKGTRIGGAERRGDSIGDAAAEKQVEPPASLHPSGKPVERFYWFSCSMGPGDAPPYAPFTRCSVLLAFSASRVWEILASAGAPSSSTVVVLEEVVESGAGGSGI
ncbi:hypothetical protein BESB_026460 [Besnoitia besnoiti]|uniref:Uncharacterized protein n=1 Tax=Besnoitia besnoiti TaxID=94643 RepID=A0A2A9M8F8_BESBE|nr:uncharacterized protein BESB_026460 [Besnoitia besnoiti]PFH31672.1 hypothetical protein BESB_026460 [Besnoitia besnoiti]